MLRKIFKYFLYFIGAIIALIFVFIIYDKYESSVREKEQKLLDAERKNSELKFHTFFAEKDGEKIDWEWLDENEGIQIHHGKYGESILRKVHLIDEYAVYVINDEEYKFTTVASFKAQCEPEATVKTNAKYSTGELMTLTCDKSGQSLYVDAYWTTPPKQSEWTWVENLGGFKIYENFSNWNFDILDREITLKKAKKPSDKFDPSTAKKADKK